MSCLRHGASANAGRKSREERAQRERVTAHGVTKKDRALHCVRKAQAALVQLYRISRVEPCPHQEKGLCVDRRVTWPTHITLSLSLSHSPTCTNTHAFSLPLSLQHSHRVLSAPALRGVGSQSWRGIEECRGPQWDTKLSLQDAWQRRTDSVHLTEQRCSSFLLSSVAFKYIASTRLYGPLQSVGADAECEHILRKTQRCIQM